MDGKGICAHSVSGSTSQGWHVIRARDAIAQLEQQWRLLETRWEGGTPFQSFAWCNQWLRYRGRGYTPFILTNEDFSLIAPFAMSTMAGSRVLRLIGTGDSDYLGLITSMPPKDAWRRVVAELCERRSDWELLHLHSIRQREEVLAALRQQESITVLERDYETCPNLPIRETWDAYLHRRKKVKHESRRWAKRVREFGVITVDAIALPLPFELVREMIDVERESWKWELGSAALKPGEQADFVCALLQDPRTPAKVWCLRANTRLAAFAVVLEDKVGWYYYLPSFRKSCPNAGAHLLACIVQEAFKQGRRFIDLLQGAHEYKLLWTDDSVGVAEILAAHSLGGRIMLQGYSARWRASRSAVVRRLWNIVRHVGDRRRAVRT